MRKQSLLKGTIILGVATIFARFLGLFFRIPIQNLIGDQGMGYYQMSYPIYMTFVAIASGVPIAMSKLISEFNAKNDINSIEQVLKQTLKIMIPLGFIASFLMMYFGKSIVNFLKWDPKSYNSFMVISCGPVFVCIMCTFKGYFQGLQNMNSTAVSQVVEQLGRVLFGVLFAYILLPRGIEYAAAGAVFGTVIGGVFGSVYLGIKYFKVKGRGHGIKTKKDSEILGILTQAALPISVGAAVGTIMALIDSVIVPQRLLVAGYTIEESAGLYGQFSGKAMTLQNIPLALSIALCAALVPIVSELYSMRNQRELSRRIDMVFKLSFVIGIPSCLGLFFMAKPIMGLVFMGDIAGYEILKLLSLTIPLIIITQTTTSLLQSCGRYMMPVYYLGVGCIFKVIITYVLVGMPGMNIYGAVIGSIVGYGVTSILNIIEVKRLLRVKIGFYEVFIKPLFISLIMIIAVVFIYNNVYNYTISNGISCLVAIAIGVTIYGILAMVFRVFTFEDIRGKFTGK
ncbi:MAG: polysaccharide biosynthesis protein [Clostridium sp.]|uniref:putative polysaccharide biosynthesis protein n=1 Tax=Clostridium sp. TaxID=1506 RepID=UPI0030529548